MLHALYRLVLTKLHAWSLWHRSRKHRLILMVTFSGQKNNKKVEVDGKKMSVRTCNALNKNTVHNVFFVDAVRRVFPVRFGKMLFSTQSSMALDNLPDLTLVRCIIRYQKVLRRIIRSTFLYNLLNGFARTNGGIFFAGITRILLFLKQTRILLNWDVALRNIYIYSIGCLVE